MIIVISPAKKLDYSEETRYTTQHSIPKLLKETGILLKDLGKKSPKDLQNLMNISEDLANLNHERYQNFSFPFNEKNAKQALLSFNGDVYQSFQLDRYDESDFEFAQRHLRILSGLYGLLKPLDLIQPYRLEMGTKMANERGKDLYAFWGDQITEAINHALSESEEKVLINLASNEYFKSIKTKQIDGRILTLSFKEERNGGFKAIFLYVKQARGAMADFIIRNKITDIEGLKAFDGMGYHFNESLSSDKDWVFTRES